MGPAPQRVIDEAAAAPVRVDGRIGALDGQLAWLHDRFHPAGATPLWPSR